VCCIVMDTREIEHALRDNRALQGVYALDRLPRENHVRPALYICNTHQSCLPGEHWVAIYFPPTGHAEFFDTFSRRPFKEPLRRLLGYPYIYNSRVVQALTSDRCGHHVVNYARQRSAGVTLPEIMRQYSNDLHANDLYVVSVM